MAKNREPEKPETESSEEEDDEATTEEESDSEPEPTQFTKKPSPSTPAAKNPLPQSAPKPPQPESSEDEESGSESESQSDSDGPNRKVASVATKSMNDVLKSSTGAIIPGSKPAADPVTPSKSTAGKRLAEEKETDAKKSKKKADIPESSVKKPTDDSKKPLFQRIWSEDDEIVLLKGMIEFSAKKKGDPTTDSAFYDFIKKDLDVVELTRTQLVAKIRRLKKKYLNNQSKEKEGQERILPKPHEQNAYELSKIIWGNGNPKENGGESVIESPKAKSKAKSSAVKRTPGKRAHAAENEDAKEVKSLVAVKDNTESVVPAKRAKFVGGSQEDRILLMGDLMFEDGILAEGWEKLKKEEFDAYRRQMDVKTRQIKFVLDNWKSG